MSTAVHEQGDVWSVKVVILGRRASGKTAMAMRFCHGTFATNYKTTIAIDYLMKTIELPTKKLKLQIWDTAGQERFRSLGSLFLRNATAAIVVYDITDMNSFREKENWLETVSLWAPEAKVVLVGNKADLSKARVISEEEGKRAAVQRGMAFIETSAKIGYNIDKLFYDLAEDLAADIDTKVQSAEALNKADKSQQNGCCKLS